MAQKLILNQNVLPLRQVRLTFDKFKLDSVLQLSVSTYYNRFLFGFISMKWLFIT